MLTALAGGVGAARFLRGLVQVVEPSAVTVVVNTADDDEFHGLWVSPDLDSVTYTLAGAHDAERGWGLAGETFAAVDALGRYGADTWFRLGDRDLATHLYRTQRLRAGVPLGAVTAEITRAWRLETRLLPMSDERVATRITVRAGDGTPLELSMQEWFVRDRAEPPVVAVRFEGAADARPGPGVLDALQSADTIVICPSNPVISVAPILAVPGIRAILERRRDVVVGVSPIVGGAPVKGPADRLMAPLGIDVSCVGVAREYASICRSLVIDERDAARAPEIAALGVTPVVCNTVMTDERVAAVLARHALDAASAA
ncbi:MAG: 2-phospho-L-lactate transferase [Acidimicrobiia bacterium]